MVPQWMPQNIQKRLLLYVLQQLSLFSEIDLPNLDVSLGSSSQVTLTDVEIDTEAFKIPGMHLRSGKVKNIKLELNMTGGVNIEGDGLDITVALDSSPSTLHNHDLQKSSFSLAQSTLDLANSLMVDVNLEDDETSSRSLSEPTSETTPLSQGPAGDTSRLNTMMAKAVEAALARLHIDIKNITVRVIMEHSTVDLDIERVDFSTLDGTRTVKTSGITVVAVHPNVNPGKGGDVRDESQDSSNDDQSSSEDENDDCSQNMMSSSILPNDLNDSLVYSKEEASSIYMSAASEVLQSRLKTINNGGAKLVFINELSATFTGISSVEDVNIIIDEVKIAAVPIPLTLLSIIESFGGASSYNSSGRLPKTESKFKAKGQSTQSNGNPLFKNLLVRKVFLNLESALTDDGSFASDDETSLCIEHFEVQYVNATHCHGFLNKIFITEGDEVVGEFEEDSDKNDLRFELMGDDLTVLVSKKLQLNLKLKHFQSVINLSSLAPQISESLAKLKSKRPIRKQEPGNIIVQTSAISLNLNLSDSSGISLQVSPLSYTSSNGELSIQKVVFSRNSSGQAQNVLTVENIRLLRHLNNKQIRSFDTNGHESFLMTQLSLEMKSISLVIALSDLQELINECSNFSKLIEIPAPDIVFKGKKKARTSSNVMFQSRQLLKLLVSVHSVNLQIKEVSPVFGDIIGELKKNTVLLHKDGSIQTHIMTASVERKCADAIDYLVSIINPDDRSTPMISARTKNFKTFHTSLRNTCIDYHTRWLSMLNGGKQDSLANSEGISDSENIKPDSEFEIKLNISDSSIGLNPERLKSKATLVIPSGNIDIIVMPNVVVRSELRNASLLLIDDISNIVTHELARSTQSMRSSWTQASYLSSRGHVSVGHIKQLLVNILVKFPVDPWSSSSVVLDINSESLDLNLCADSSQCLMQLLSDLKQPIIIKPDLKYKVNGNHEINVFEGIENNMFINNNLSETTAGKTEMNTDNSNTADDEPLDFVEGYYEGPDDSASNILEQDLENLAIKSDNLNNNPFFNPALESETGFKVDSKSETSDSTLLFNDSHFNSGSVDTVKGHESGFPVVVMVEISKVTIKIHDGYDWKYTRKTISNAVKRLEKKALEQQELKKVQHTQSGEARTETTSDQVVGETVFDSIIVSLPLSTDPSKLTQIINKDISNKVGDDSPHIDVGKKSNIKKLKLRRTKHHKVMVQLDHVMCNFTVLSNKDPLSCSEIIDDFDVLNELVLEVKDFSVTDNVPTSTWNKFVTYLKDSDREKGSKMLKVNMKTVRPVVSLAATEFILNVNVLPLRLHVDQDTLEVLTRFGEFKDARFALIDEYEDIPYVQRFDINPVHVVLDYKPKKVDYAGLKSGHTTEFMNFFILDGADMVLKSVTLYGISGFSKLGVALNDLWMPDIKSNQLSGILTGLAPVRSIAKIGSGIKDLVVVPANEYKKDGRLYRSISKGVQQFTKTTTSEVLKFGVKLAAGTQQILENAEEALGGTGSAARVPIAQDEAHGNNDDYHDDDSDLEYEDVRNFGQSSQLIGRGSAAPLQRSVYQPALESIVDINPVVSLSPRSRYRKGSFARTRGYDGDESGGAYNVDDEEIYGEERPKTVSLYAEQPANLKEGFFLAYDSFGRNLLVAKEAIINAGTEISESGSAHDTTMAVLRATPVVLLRPVIGATEAASRALLGFNNQLDPGQRDYTKDKYKGIKK